MSIMDELKAEEAKLRGIKAPRGQGNGYNMPGGGKKLAKRLQDVADRAGKGGQSDERED
jgi:hypothetical protein